MEAAKAYQTIYDTINKASPEDQEKLDDAQGSERSSSFRNFVIYLMVSPYTPEKVDLMNVIESMYPRELEKEEHVGKYLRKLLTFELMPLHEDEIE